MREQQILTDLEQHGSASAAGNLDAKREIYQEDAVCEYPQSGERIHGAAGPPKLILIAIGSEESIALEAHNQLTGEGVASRVISMLCWDLFRAQPQSHKDMVLRPGAKARVSG